MTFNFGTNSELNNFDSFKFKCKEGNKVNLKFVATTAMLVCLSVGCGSSSDQNASAPASNSGDNIATAASDADTAAIDTDSVPPEDAVGYFDDSGSVCFNPLTEMTSEKYRKKNHYGPEGAEKGDPSLTHRDVAKKILVNTLAGKFDEVVGYCDYKLLNQAAYNATSGWEDWLKHELIRDGMDASSVEYLQEKKQGDSVVEVTHNTNMGPVYISLVKKTDGAWYVYCVSSFRPNLGR